MALPPYEKPAIARISRGVVSKFGQRLHAPSLEAIDGVPVATLLERHGSPLVVFSEARLRARARDLKAAFELRYPRVQTAWSYKTNRLGAICRILHREGALAEVVSPLELDRAFELGVPGDRIIYNGPYKPADSLERALRAGVLVNADGREEIDALEAVASALPGRPRIGVRVNLSVPGAPRWDRFGFALENKEAMAAIERIRAGGVLELRALHCHIGTFVAEPRAYEVAAARMAELLREAEARTGFRVDVLDLGGGFASRNRLRGTYLPSDDATPSFFAYAEAMVAGLAELATAPEPPTLVLETGRAVVDDAGFILATVVATKQLPDGRRALTADCGTGILPTATWFRHELRPGTSRDGRPVATVVFGPSCMQVDVLADGVMLAPLSVGDPLVIMNAGAYNVTQWSQFSQPRPAVVLVRRDRSVEVIRRRETPADLSALEVIPDDLSP